MRNLLKPIVAGLVIGLVICIAGWITETRAGPAPSGSDPLMASSMIFEVGAMPIALLTGNVVYRAKEASQGSIGWRVLDAGQVLVNWVLIAILMWWLVMAIRARGHPKTSEGTS
jgi:formate/nitrite transporter FocA (FNT family)